MKACGTCIYYDPFDVHTYRDENGDMKTIDRGKCHAEPPKMFSIPGKTKTLGGEVSTWTINSERPIIKKDDRGCVNWESSLTDIKKSMQ